MRLATVCARAGSKRLPDKALREINGQSLLAHTVAQAMASEMFDAVAVSSDSIKLLVIGRNRYATHHVYRPPELATDAAGKVPAIRHALLDVEQQDGKTFDHIIDLDVTAPLRTLDDIRGFCAKLDTMKHGNLVSVCKARRSPYFNMIERYPYDGFELCKHAKQRTVLRSQDAPEVFELNASMYGWHRNALLNGGNTVIGPETDIYEMPRERSWDIDDAHDLEIVEFLMSKQREAHAA
jgi:CMP-N,N'-diacetyllegionaminic acid synthase